MRKRQKTRNLRIKEAFNSGSSIEELATKYFLSPKTVENILTNNTDNNYEKMGNNNPCN